MTAALPRVPDPSPPAFYDGIGIPRPWRKFTPSGLAWFRQVQIPLFREDAIFTHWKKHKREWLARGFQMSRLNGVWTFTQWLAGATESAFTLTATGAEILAAHDKANAPVVQELALAAVELVYPDLPDGMDAKLMPHQIMPARQLLRALRQGKEEWGYSGALDMSDMGTGKTYVTLCAALATGRSVGVICPPAGRKGWLAAFAHFGAEPEFLDSYEGVRGGFRPHIAARDASGNFRFKSPENLIIILDEVQNLRNEKTLSVECFSAAVRQSIPIICASATIALSPLEFRFAGRIVGLHDGGEDWDLFLLRHGCSRKSVGGKWKWNEDRATLAKIHARLFPSRGCRVRLEDLGDAAPETEIRVLPVACSAADEIEAMFREGQSTIAKLERQHAHAGRVLALRRNLRLRTWQACERALVEPVSAMVRQYVRDGFSVALFMSFDESRIRMGRALGETAGIYGGVSAKRRDWLMTEFQSDRLHILVNNVKSGGVALSLHDVLGDRPRVSFIFPTDHIISFIQSTGRVARVNAKSKSDQLIPCVVDSSGGGVMLRMVERLRAKAFNISVINDGASDGASF